MIISDVILLFLIIYYLGLSYLSIVAFKKRKIRLSTSLALFLPFFIFKSYFNLIKRNWYNKTTRNKALLDIIFGYDLALTILVEVVAFGFEKGLISSTKPEKKSFMARINNLRNNEMKSSFSKNMEAQLKYA